MEKILESDLRTCMEAFNSGQISEHAILALFAKLAKQVFDSPTHHFDLDDLTKQSLIADAAELCLQKLPKFDGSRGKAFNFFVTIISCHFRQMKRCLRSHTLVK